MYEVSNLKVLLDRLKEDGKLHFEWAEPYEGSLILKNPEEDLDKIKYLLTRDIKNEILEKMSFNRFRPEEYKRLKFVIIHQEKFNETQDYITFKAKFQTEIKDNELIKKADDWITQFPFYYWKIFAIKLLSNITYLDEYKIDEKLKEMSKYMSGLDDFVISNVEGIAKSSIHLFYPLNKLIDISSKSFIFSEDLKSSDKRDIVFIDDMIGTGHQAIKYIQKLKKDGKIGHQKLYYYAIIGLKDGIKELRNSGLFEKVIVTKEIQNKALDTGYIFTAEESGSAKEMVCFLGEQLTKDLDKIDPLGYENSEALVFFRHNTPNNSLPIFWASGECKILQKLGEDTSVKWIPLFPRKEKPEADKKLENSIALIQVESKIDSKEKQIEPFYNTKFEQNVSDGLWNVPYPRNLFFEGREKNIKQIHERLKSGRTAISQLQAIYGLGGIGKTQIAVEYAYRYRKEYAYVFWVKAYSSEEIVLDYVYIAKLLNLPLKDEQDQNLVVANVKRWLEINNGWLLIFDNADNPQLIENFIPSNNPNGHILLTSRARDFDQLGIENPIELDKMEPDEAKDFLLKRTRRKNLSEKETEAIEQLVFELDYLPLALEQAGAYIYKLPCGFQDYLTSYKKLGLELLEKAGVKNGTYNKSVATTWALNFKQIAEQSNAAADLLYAMAFLNPYSIPTELFAKGYKELGLTLSTALSEVDTNPLALDEILAQLAQYSLIHYDLDSHLCNIHRMVQAVLKDDLDIASQHLWAERVIKVVNHVFPEVEFTSWNLCDRLLPQAQISLEHIEKWGLEIPESANLLYNAGCYLHERARFEEAEPFYQKALKIREKVLEPDHPDVAYSLNDLGSLYQDKGKYTEAEPLLIRALEIREKVLEPDHPDVASSLNDLGSLYKDKGKYTEAEPLFIRALKIREKVLESDHPDVATSLDNLGSLYQKQGKYDYAEEFYKRTLNIREKVLGQDHPSVASSLGNLGSLYQDLGKYTEAEELYKRSLKIKEKVLGQDHPEVATSLGNLGSYYRVLGKYTEAEELYKRSLKIREKVLGQDHPDVSTSLNNLGLLYYNLGKYTEAEELYKKALKISEKVLGQDHSEVATSLGNLGSLYQDLGKYKEAEELCKRALKIKEKVLGQDHPHVATSLNNLGLLYHNLGKYTEAEELYKKALKIREKVLGQEHPNVATNLNNLGGLYQVLGKYTEAEEIYKRALKIKEKVLGQDHPSVASSMNNLASLYDKKRQYKEAISFYKQAIAICERHNYPDLIKFLDNYANFLNKNNKKFEAAKIKARIKAIRKE